MVPARVGEESHPYQTLKTRNRHCPATFLRNCGPGLPTATWLLKVGVRKFGNVVFSTAGLRENFPMPPTTAPTHLLLAIGTFASASYDADFGWISREALSESTSSSSSRPRQLRRKADGARTAFVREQDEVLTPLPKATAAATPSRCLSAPTFLDASPCWPGGAGLVGCVLCACACACWVLYALCRGDSLANSELMEARWTIDARRRSEA